MSFYHSIFLLLAFPFLFTLASAAKCHIDDENGLLAFKSGITEDPSGLLSSWKRGTDCCNWPGFICDTNNRVYTFSVYGNLEKSNSYLSGTISPSLSKLSFLVGINLIDLRNISGTIPDLLFHLTNLESISIENSKLSGPLPDHNIGALTRLRSLSLIGNRFSGRIPASFSKLTNLRMLMLSGNLLTGSIPNGIGQLKYLRILGLDWNKLSGPIPDISAQSSFPQLEKILLSHNKLTGPIPASISALAPVLKFLYLDHNYLTGEIPSFLGNFKALDTLDLSSNRYTGFVPKSFENLTIFSLNLSYNFLVDPFPAMNSDAIQELDLSYNLFRFRKIPNWITSLPTIFSLKLAKCGIKMKLDDWKPKVAYDYEHIDLSDNDISGSPVGLVNRTNRLVSFKASNNQLKFKLEKLRIVETLEELDLGGNNVYGKVTKAVIGLKKLNVSCNKLCGSIPPNKFPLSAFVGNGCLCGAPLTPCH